MVRAGVLGCWLVCTFRLGDFGAAGTIGTYRKDAVCSLDVAAGYGGLLGIVRVSMVLGGRCSRTLGAAVTAEMPNMAMRMALFQNMIDDLESGFLMECLVLGFIRWKAL